MVVKLWMKGKDPFDVSVSLAPLPSTSLDSTRVIEPAGKPGGRMS